MTQAYCFKDRKKVEIKNAAACETEERKARHQGNLPSLRHQGIPHR